MVRLKAGCCAQTPATRPAITIAAPATCAVLIGVSGRFTVQGSRFRVHGSLGVGTRLTRSFSLSLQTYSIRRSFCRTKFNVAVHGFVKNTGSSYVTMYLMV